MAIQISIFLCKARCIFIISSSFDIFVVYNMFCERLFDALSDIPKIHDLVHLIWNWVSFQEAVISSICSKTVFTIQIWDRKLARSPELFMCRPLRAGSGWSWPNLLKTETVRIICSWNTNWNCSEICVM